VEPDRAPFGVEGSAPAGALASREVLLKEPSPYYHGRTSVAWVRKRQGQHEISYIGSTMSYTFEQLSPEDFQLLARDLIQSERHLRLESYSPGPDQGIDLRHACANGDTIIVQCKHHKEYRALRRALTMERKKLARFPKTTRYIVATSVWS